jgi:hypothetical protein
VTIIAWLRDVQGNAVVTQLGVDSLRPDLHLTPHVARCSAQSQSWVDLLVRKGALAEQPVEPCPEEEPELIAVGANFPHRHQLGEVIVVQRDDPAAAILGGVATALPKEVLVGKRATDQQSDLPAAG